MDKKLFRSLMLLITFTVGLILLIVKFDTLWDVFGRAFAILTPLFVGLAIAFVLSRPCAFFRRLFDRAFGKSKLNRLSLPLAVVISYLILFGVVAAVFAFVIPELVFNIGRFASNLSGYVDQAQVWLNGLLSSLHLEQLDLSKLDQVLKNLLDGVLAALSGAVPQLVNLTNSIVTVVINVALSFVFSVYMLAGKDYLLSQCRRIMKAYLPDSLYRRLLDVAALTAGTFSKFVMGQVTDACILGTLTFIGMLIFRFEYALLIAVLIGVSALVPIVGAYVGAFTSALLLAMIDPLRAVWFLIMLVCLQQFEGNVVYPRVVGTSLGLPGIWVLAAVTVGGGLFGFVGMLLSVPVASILYTLVKKDVHKRLGEARD